MCHLLHLSIILSNIYFHSRALITRQGADLSLSTARRQAHQLQSAGSLELTGHQVNTISIVQFRIILSNVYFLYNFFIPGLLSQDKVQIYH